MFLYRIYGLSYKLSFWYVLFAENIANNGTAATSLSWYFYLIPLTQVLEYLIIKCRNNKDIFSIIYNILKYYIWNMGFIKFIFAVFPLLNMW